MQRDRDLEDKKRTCVYWFWALLWCWALSCFFIAFVFFTSLGFLVSNFLFKRLS
ncbi:unnamed protein product [Arabidopsis halleri]